MSFNPYIENLQPYPFEKLRRLTQNVTANVNLPHIPLSLGEPKHAPPEFVLDALADRSVVSGQLATYPATKGSDALRQSISDWLNRRFATPVDSHTQILPVNGTREALFAFAQAMLSGRAGSKVMIPNPFYQIYEGAALLAGADVQMIDNEKALCYQQNFEQVPNEVWEATELVYICSPGNPTGHIMSLAQQQTLIERAHQFDFLIASDECYAELYFDDAAPPPSLLNASQDMGNLDYARCVVFHSLSKRSNLPGLRSGFTAGCAHLMESFLKYRTYHGCALSPHHQQASTLAWQDDLHVQANRQLYRDKFAAVSEILAPVYPLTQPDGGFYHWLPTPIDDQKFCQQLLQDFNVTVMPGSFLARDTEQGNPGANHVRVAWVAPLQDCIEAAKRLRAFGEELLHKHQH
jgi:N-succinyldiaminopimelate aminotransferase